jgi:hypothetical protein
LGFKVSLLLRAWETIGQLVVSGHLGRVAEVVTKQTVVEFGLRGIPLAAGLRDNRPARGEWPLLSTQPLATFRFYL